MSSIFDPGKKARRAAQSMAQGGLIDNIFSSDSFFGGGSFNDGRFTSTQGQLGRAMNPMIMQMMQSMGGDQPGGFGDFQSAAADATGALGGLTPGQAQTFQAPQQQQFQADLRNQMFGNAGGLFSVLGKSAEELGAGQLDIARQIAAPEEQRARVSNQQQLFSQGRMGTTGGALQAQGLAQAQAQADLARQQMAFQQGQAVKGQALNQFGSMIGQGLGMQGMENQINAQNFGQALAGSQQDEALRMGQMGRDLGYGGFNAQRALDRFGIAGNIFDASRQQQMMPWQQLGLGLGALGQIQGMGLNQFNTGLNAEIARSNSYGQGSQTMANIAANTRSPFMDLLTGGMSMFNFGGGGK